MTKVFMFNPIVLENANCVDFQHDKIIKCALLIRNGVIERTIFKGNVLPHHVKKIDLNNGFLIPGFIDSHTHLLSRGIELQRIDLGRCISLNNCLEKLRSRLHKSEILFGSNWDETIWHKDEREKLNKSILDRISKKVPIIMRRVCGHFAVVNTRALELIPRHWQIVDTKNGYLFEDVALNLNEIFKPTDEMLAKAVEIASVEALSCGITSVHEIANPRRFQILQKMRDRLKVRFAIYLPVKCFKQVLSTGMTSGLGDDWLKFLGIKIYIDGSIGAHTAALKKPFCHTKKRGLIIFPMNRLVKFARQAENHCIQLMIHSLGDRATNHVLKTLEHNIQRQNPLRHRLEHLELIDESSINKLAKLNLIASMQPNFVRRWQKPGGMYEKMLGKRYKEMNCFKKLLSVGTKVVFGSDCMPMGPLYGIQGALYHPFDHGRLKNNEAFKLYTEEAAYATFDENKKGRIEVGKFADLVVLNKNPLKEKDVEKIKILMVFVDGKLHYRVN